MNRGRTLLDNFIYLTSWKLFSNNWLSRTGSWSHRLEVSRSIEWFFGSSPKIGIDLINKYEYH